MGGFSHTIRTRLLLQLLRTSLQVRPCPYMRGHGVHGPCTPRHATRARKPTLIQAVRSFHIGVDKGGEILSCDCIENPVFNSRR